MSVRCLLLCTVDASVVSVALVPLLEFGGEIDVGLARVDNAIKHLHTLASAQADRGPALREQILEESL